MYHIRRSDDHDERSLHMESPEGLWNATQEATLRSEYTGVPHEIVDDNGRIVGHVLSCREGPRVKLKSQAKPIGKLWYLATAFMAAAVLFKAIWGKEIF